MKCKVCNSEKVVTEKHGEKFFVICKSEACASRGIGRPLSNGKDSAEEAEKDYTSSLDGEA